jgi:hypothetical protein
MRKVITRSVLAVAAVLLVASSARAELIPIGQFEWLELDDQTSEGTLSVINQTGPDTTNDFPVTDLLTFDVLNISDGASVNLAIGDLTTSLNVLFALVQRPLATTLQGSIVAPGGPITLFSAGNPAWTGLFNVVSTNLVNSSGGVLTLPTTDIWETELIYIDVERVVPEPLTMSLLAVGLAGTLVRRRRAARQ